MRVSVLTPSIRPEGLKIVQECLTNQTFQDFEWLVEVGIPNRGHDLNRAYNRMLKRSKGELIVSYQDWIKIPDDGIEQFVKAHNESPKFYTAPVGQTVNKYFLGDIKWDWRVSPEAIMDWMRWEIDWGCAPREALFKIGGFDEELDEFWTFDNVNVGYRAMLDGYEFGHLPNNKAIAWNHDAFEPHPFRNQLNAEFHNERLDWFKMGNRIDYLNVL